MAEGQRLANVTGSSLGGIQSGSIGHAIALLKADPGRLLDSPHWLRVHGLSDQVRVVLAEVLAPKDYRTSRVWCRS